MLIEIGQVEALFRYPVKSMAGERLAATNMGWHGIEGDRRLALRRLDDRSGMPWLTASRLPDLVLFTPQNSPLGGPEDVPKSIRTPDGREFPALGEALAAEVGKRHGAPVQMMQLRHGIFDETCISVISSGTIAGIARLAGRELDARRFRPNILLKTRNPVTFEEDQWVGGVLSFGESEDAPAISVTTRDLRCAMVNLDPDTARPQPEVMKAIVRENQNYAGVYGVVTRTGRLQAGQTVFLRRAISV